VNDQEYLELAKDIDGNFNTLRKVVGEQAYSNGYKHGVVYHGTTHQFNVFTKDRGNPENNLGIGFYFTTSDDDVLQNYTTVDGPDLSQRIGTRSEQLLNQDEDLGEEEALSIARQELAGRW